MLKIDPKDELAWYVKGKAHLEIKEYDKAIECYDKSLEKVLTGLRNGVSLMYTSKYRKAVKIIIEKLEIYKNLEEEKSDLFLLDIANTQKNLGNICMKLGRLEDTEIAYCEALKFFKKLEEKNPKKYINNIAEIQNNLGSLFGKLKRFEDAEWAYLEALNYYKILEEHKSEKDLGYIVKIKTNLGSLYEEFNEFENAVLEYLEVLKIYTNLKEHTEYMPKIAFIQKKLGILYEKLNKIEDAEIAYAEALKLYQNMRDKNSKINLSNLKNIQKKLAMIYWNLKKFKDSEEIFNQLLEIDPNNSIAYFHKACIESERNNKEQSLQLLRKAINLDEKYRNLAKNHNGFEKIRDSKEFAIIMKESILDLICNKCSRIFLSKEDLIKHQEQGCPFPKRPKGYFY